MWEIFDSEYQEERNNVYNNEYVPKKEKKKRAEDLLKDIKYRRDMYNEYMFDMRLEESYDILGDYYADWNAGTLLRYYSDTVSDNKDRYIAIVEEYKSVIEKVETAISSLETTISTLESEISALKNEYNFVF